MKKMKPGRKQLPSPDKFPRERFDFANVIKSADALIKGKQNKEAERGRKPLESPQKFRSKITNSDPGLSKDDDVMDVESDKPRLSDEDIKKLVGSVEEDVKRRKKDVEIGRKTHQSPEKLWLNFTNPDILPKDEDVMDIEQRNSELKMIAEALQRDLERNKKAPQFPKKIRLRITNPTPLPNDDDAMDVDTHREERKITTGCELDGPDANCRIVQVRRLHFALLLFSKPLLVG